MSASTEDVRARLQRLRGFLEQDFGNASLALEVAELHARLGEHAEAESVLIAALAKQPTHPRLRSQLASTLIAANQIDRAVDTLKTLIASGEDHPALRYNLAYALLLARRPQEARDLLVGALAHPDAPKQTRVLLARVLHHCGDIEGASGHITAYLEEQPEDPEALGVASLLHLDAGRMDLARDTAEKAVRHGAGDPDTLVTLGTLALDRQDPAAAEDYFKRVVERQPVNGRAWTGMGLAAMVRLDLDRAIEHLRRAVQHMPGHIGSWHSLAWCQILKRDFTAARASFDTAMALDRSFGETHGGLAVVDILQGRPESAEPGIKRALRLDPNSFAGRFAQSLLLAKSDPAASQALVQKILSSSVVEGGETLQDILRRMPGGPGNTKPPG